MSPGPSPESFPGRSAPRRLLAALLLALVLAGCAGDPPRRRLKVERPPNPPAAPAPVPAVRVATVKEVRECALLADLGSLGPRLGETAEDSLSRTRAELMAKARRDGATHLVWGEARFPYAPASSVARTYRCPMR